VTRHQGVGREDHLGATGLEEAPGFFHALGRTSRAPVCGATNIGNETRLVPEGHTKFVWKRVGP